ncbi:MULTISPECIES: flagellar type III secretion system pore protein FliP [Alteromonadaceae]|uniref:flagellar type III secretion system pore protein FliP n=1 Tax=Alteromonadaceae TaxID=72275 RepID=UPI001C08A032|nr:MULTISPECIES: flagellar type III secretion system pore protein FliP [Aliiglaciecola]MBU2878029.1 flagellar type III secretion system pore protein FliP [Aliiglaciecola lipolytica]MDO6709394.1 flagellar type III secretion system pore protein FliP [Aliiglaciecola sp. 2_MG-2023]MDO6750542.1 flagellar type III secretion system pore protein FliP [Aliiglaciecola sp. 1_MG-2023]
MIRFLLVLLGAILLAPTDALAAPGVDALTITTNPDGTQDYTMTLQVLAIMTALSLLPAFVMMMTSFTRIIIVLSILRQAIGLQQSPSNQILIGVSLFLSMFIMAPVFEQINENALQPYLNEEMTSLEAYEQAKIPMRAFMLSQTRIKDLETFVQLGDMQGQFDDPSEVPMNVLIPAFVTSELKTAFQIGFMLFIPFLILDLVVASILMAMGMMMLSPMIVSLPFKLMLFVLVDGWNLIFGTLATSFGLG